MAFWTSLVTAVILVIDCDLPAWKMSENCKFLRTRWV